MHTRVALISIFVSAVFVGGLFLAAYFSTVPYAAVSSWTLKEKIVEVPAPPITIAMVGDIMLARDVEQRLLKQEPGYPLSAIKSSLQADIVLANFEASVPSLHVPTQTMEMRFSVLPALLSRLSSDFTHVSLANNHALDYGSDGYQNTIKELGLLGIKSAGHPSRVSSSSVFVEEFKTRKVIAVNINATYGYPSLENVKGSLPQGIEEKDLLVAYVHWGEEYELTHNQYQQDFAHALIDSGFDLIVGHHPHVVQDIERYGDGLIFYSLGNFIFDQYWRPEVEQGLLLRLTERETDWRIEVVPVESHTVRVQPREMTDEDRGGFLQSLAKRSSESLKADIAKGELLLQF